MPGDDLQFLVLLPDDVDGLRALESKLAEHVWQNAQSSKRRKSICICQSSNSTADDRARRSRALGMKSAFDIPQGSANFDKIAPRKPNDYLYISNVFHKTFIAVDEKEPKQPQPPQ
jgi:serine protease inhibitor